MKFKRALNGYILESPEGDIIYQDTNDEDEIERFCEFLFAINEHLGPQTSRYSPKRIHILIEPGDKFEG